MSLLICEIFKSIQGESTFVGLPCVFVRLSGCNLNCTYCDTGYAKSEGYELDLSRIADTVKTLGVRLVEITGGEPLIQEETPLLAEMLSREGYLVLVETNGSLDISVLPEGVVRIMDIKCPSSGESHSNRWENLDFIRPGDEIKFVVCDRLDYEWAARVIMKELVKFSNTILISPVYGQLAPQELAQWILEDNLDVRLQVQVHKYIWSPHARGV
ncbi:MAG: 7-carboxy-7-deazaguanine synthase [Thermodesulfobacteriota bacterium]|nr:7-carboxy-7-deazaguanine synthase [Thermodesulfobacteriota bacterium]